MIIGYIKLINFKYNNSWEDIHLAKDYSNKSLKALKREQQVRERPNVIFGTKDADGCAHSIFEIIANSIDEARENTCDTIEVWHNVDGTVRVRDNGRGVPMDWNEEENKYNWELVFCTLYASGKYDSDNYGESLGLNGLGATATQYASEFMNVVSIRDDNGYKKYTMNFKKGRPIGELKVEEATGEHTGTDITFKPDREVFTDINIPVHFYMDRLRRAAMLLPKVKFILHYEGTKEITLYYPDGIKGFIDEACSSQMLKAPIYFTGEAFGEDDEANDEPYKLGMDIAITFAREQSLIELYHNNSYLEEGGVTLDALRYSVAKVIEDAAKKSGKIGRTDKILFKDIEEILVAVGATNCPGHRTEFVNQTKKAIKNPFIKKAFNDFIFHNFSRWMAENRVESDRIIAEAVANKEARERAEEVKKNVLRRLSSSIDKFSERPSKFVECASKNPLERELYIVEGDSAKGSVKLARDGKFQAIMPIRGKIMNCLKEDLTRILNSDIIVDLLKVIGCGIEAESKHVKDLPKFDVSKLNWGKIIICTDADIDGMQIRCLLITMIYRLIPTLIKMGKVYIAETPLFEITAKGNTHFAYNEPEKVKILNELYSSGIKDSQIRIQRSKGLGENDPEMMHVSTMNPLTRRLVPVEYPENDKDLPMLFEALLGSDIVSRKYLIEEYFNIEVDID